MAKKKLSTEPYKGVRDFYPEDRRLQSMIFDIWSTYAESYGYEGVNASVLEPTEIYTAKTSEEIVSEQTYTFEDRGGRSVTLRPEFTPTVARMIAHRWRDLGSPIRWYSIPNVFRYERPQKGRLREHWQLNCDIFGVETIDAELEMISLAMDIITHFKMPSRYFLVRINDRQYIEEYLDGITKNTEQRKQLVRLIDKKDKIDDFDGKVEELIGRKLELPTEPNEKIAELLKKLKDSGVENAIFDPTLMRGFDYYTGIVFEIFDTNPDNNRAVCGGGRYDNLLENYGERKMPAVGFGLGDVTYRDILETYDVLPDLPSSTDLCICIMDEKYRDKAREVAADFRKLGVNVYVNYILRRIPNQIKQVERSKIQNILFIGDEEFATGNLIVKNLKSRKEKQSKKVKSLAKFICKER